MAKETQESMKSEPWFRYRSIHESDLQKLKDELKESNEKLALVKEVLEQQDQAVWKNLLDTLRQGNEKTCTKQDEEPLNVSKDVGVPTTPKIDSQPPAQTSLDPQPSKEQNEPSQNPLSDLIAQWDREKASRKAKKAQPCGMTEKLLIAFSICDLTVRLILLVTLWCCSTRGWSSTSGGDPSTIQVTVAYFTPPATLVGMWRMGFARCMIGDGGAEGDRILGLVERTDMAALGVAGALMVSLAVQCGLVM